MRTQWQVEDSIASEPPLALFESKSEHDPSSRLLNSDSAQQAFLYHYLKTGAAPWWYRGPLSHRQVITTQLSREPMQMTTMLRRLGQLDVVRKRLVWQYFPTPLNEVVKALEPHHHEAIESYAERLIALQQQQRLGSHRPSIARQSWYWILTHLFVERGSLFNTTAFVISTIAKMAAHYQLDYATLLRQMVQAAQGLEQTHPQLPVFIRALLNAEQKLPSKVSELATGSSELDHWQRFKQLLEGRLPAALAGPKTLAEMFAWLVRVDPQRMAIILRRVRDRESVLRQLLETFSEAEKAAVVVALLPDDHAFVLGHIQHSQEVLSVASSSALAAVWKTILTSLLAHTGNALNRHQLVTHSLQQWSQVYDVEYSLLLELLTHTPMNPQIRSTQRRELVSLLAEIRQEQAKQPHGKHNDSKVPSRSLFTHYHQQLRQYLLQGQAVAPDGVAGLLQPSMLLQLLLYRDPDGLATVLRQSWAASHRSPRWLSRLLKLTTSADAPMLIHSLVPRVADWLIPLLTLDMEQGFESGLRWLLRPLHSEWTIQHALTTLTMSSSTLLRTLRRIDYETTSKRLGPTLPDVLHSELQKWLQQQARNQSKDEASLIKKLLQWLREQHPSDSPALATLLRELPPSKSHDLLDALRQDPQGHQLARTLVKQEPKIPVLATWLSTLWFHPDIAPQTLAAILTRNIRASGLWQGSTTLLEQHIYQQMWLSVLTHAGTDATSDTFWSHLFLGLTRSLAISSQQLLPSFRELGHEVDPVIETLFVDDSWFQQQTKASSEVLSKSKLIQKDEAPESEGERKDKKEVLRSESLSSDSLVAKELTTSSPTLRRTDDETTSKRLGQALPDVLRNELQEWLQQPARNQGKDEASLIKKLLQWLREQHSSDSSALATLLREIPPSKGHDLLDALRQDPQGHQLARTLVKQEPKIPVLATWLSTLWFHPDIAPQTLAAMLTRNIRASGQWEGSTTLLEQRIYQQMWLSVLTHAGTGATSNKFWSHLFLGLTRSLAMSSQQLLPSFRALGYDVTPVVKTLFLNDSRFQLPTKVTHAALSKSESLPSDVLSKSRLVQKDEAPEPGGERKDKAVLNSEPLSSDLLVAKEPWSIDATGQYLQQPAMAQVLSHWLRYGQAPLWWSSTPSLSLKALLADVLAFAPELLVATLRQEQKQSTHLATVLRRLSYEIDFSALLALMKQQEPGIRPRLTELAHIHQQFAEGLFQNITPAFRDLPCLLLWEHVVQHWLSGNWKALQTQTVLLALYQQLIRRYPQTQQEVTEAFEASFQEHVAQQQLTPVTQLEQLLGPLVPNTKNNPSTSYETPLQEVSLVVTNAGLVILQHFFRMYFSRLKLMDDDGFSSKQNQLDAVHWLQYLATGHQETDEPHLVLNKVLCGLPIRAPVSSGIEVSEQQRKLAESMIKAVIQHWTAIGSSSVSGFRGNWLVRDGLLREDDERWTLEVEKRPYDLLLDRLPFGFSLVNLPWMKKPLYVSWST